MIKNLKSLSTPGTVRLDAEGHHHDHYHFLQGCLFGFLKLEFAKVCVNFAIFELVVQNYVQIRS